MERQISRYITIVLLVSLCIVSRAQDTTFLDMTSPSLKAFLLQRPKELECLTNIFSQVFTNKKVEIFYFYSEEDSKPRSFQTYPDESTVNISIRENQKPVDQFICLVYESLNSEGSVELAKICQRAESGNISKEDFAQGLLKIEFGAVKKTRDILTSLKLKKRDISESDYYESFKRCPDEFKAFISYEKSTSTNYDPIANYEAQYDAIQKH